MFVINRIKTHALVIKLWKICIHVGVNGNAHNSSNNNNERIKPNSQNSHVPYWWLKQKEKCLADKPVYHPTSGDLTPIFQAIKQVHWNHSKLSINFLYVLPNHRIVLSYKAIPKLTIIIIWFLQGGSYENYTFELCGNSKFQNQKLLFPNQQVQPKRREASVYLCIPER